MFPFGTAAEIHLPPYRISREDKLVLVKVNANITLKSYQALRMGISEYLTDSVRVLFDFGTTMSLDEAILIEINKLVEDIEKYSGAVKAVSSNLTFVDMITRKENVPYLASNQAFPH